MQLRAGLTTSEVDAIIAKGHECEAGECSIDAVDGLVHELMDQQKVLSERVAELENMITSLEIMNGSDKREVDEVRETVRAIFRIFQMSGKGSGNDYPALSKPTGYPGEVASVVPDPTSPGYPVGFERAG